MRRERDSPPAPAGDFRTRLPKDRRDTPRARVCRTTAEPGGFGQTAPSERRAPVGCRRDRQGQEAYDDDAAPAPRPARRRENSGRRSPLEGHLLRKASGPVDFPNVPPCRSVSSLLPGSRTHPPHALRPVRSFPKSEGSPLERQTPRCLRTTVPGEIEVNSYLGGSWGVVKAWDEHVLVTVTGGFAA